MIGVSIIVPIYNVEKYLCECLDSILNQTLKNIEIICVDDGSTDNCPRILDAYANKDARIRVIHKKNEGYGKAINVGMDIAQGEYIGIVESDDFILPEMYETLYNVAMMNELDLVKSDFCFSWEGFVKKHHNSDMDGYYNLVLDRKYKKYYFKFIMNNWTGIYNRNFLIENNIRHNETPGASYQDQGFWFLTMSMCKRAMWIDKAFYMYRQDNPLSSVKNRTKMMAIVNEYDYIEKILYSKALKEEYNICRYYRMRGHRVNFRRISDELKREYAYIIKRDFEKDKDVVFHEESNNDEELYKWLLELSENPEKFCDRLIDEKAFKYDVLKRTDEIVIYGTGVRAIRITLKLKELGLYHKIHSYAVTYPSIDNIFFECEVKEISKLDAKDKLVLISAKKDSKVFEEMVTILNRLSIRNYIDSDGIEYL